MKFQIKNNYILLLTLTSIFIFFVNLDVLVINIMEARNFITAREMIHDGHWLLTTLNAEPRYQKPPLPTWITAFFGLLFGLKNIFALRLPAALAALLLVITSYKFGQKTTSNKHYAFISALILATSFYIVFAGRNGQWDIFTHAFMMVSIYQIYLLFTHTNKKYLHALLGGLFFGFSFMSKGPVSMYALWLPFLISFFITYKVKNLKGYIAPLLLYGIISLVISGWWHLYVYMFDSEALTAITQKETTNWKNYNVKPFYYYWSFFTQSGVWTIPAFISLLYPYLKNKVFNKNAYKFTWLWTLTSVILLSVIPEKKARYLLPVLIPLAFNTAFYIEYLMRKFKTLTNKRETFPMYFNFGLIALIGIVFPIAGYIYLNEKLTGYWFWFIALAISLFTIGLFILISLKRKNISLVFYLTIAFIAAITTFGLPLSKAIVYNPNYKSTALLHEWQKETKLNVYNFSGFTPEMIWAYGKPIPAIIRNGKVIIPEEDKFGVLVDEASLTQFKDVFKTYKIQKITRYDMNPNAPKTRTHRPRLWKDLYVVSKH